MNPKNPKISNGYGHVYFIEKEGVQSSLDEIKKKPHPRWGVTAYLLNYETPKMATLRYIRNNVAPPVRESGDSSNQNRIEYPHKNFQNYQNYQNFQNFQNYQNYQNCQNCQNCLNQKVTNKAQNKNDYANFANSEIRSQKNHWDNFDYSLHPMSQPHNFYQVSLPRDPNMTQSHYYGKHGFEQQILPDQTLMHEQLVSDQDYYQQYADPSYFGQKRYHRNYYDVQNYADSNSQFYDQGTMESYLNPNYEHQFSNENNPDMLYWCYPEYYSWPSFYNNENQSQWYGNYDNFQHFDQGSNNYDSPVHAHFSESYDGQNYSGTRLRPHQSGGYGSVNGQM